MKERWYLQTKKADFNEISRKFNISPILARLLRNRNVIGDENIKKCIAEVSNYLFDFYCDLWRSLYGHCDGNCIAYFP